MFPTPFPTSRRTLPARLGALWLIVAAILSHAALPTGSALQRNMGSAFSATTSDVTTIPRRERDKDRADTGQVSNRSDNAAGHDGAAVTPGLIALTIPPNEHGAPVAHFSRAPPDLGVPSSFNARAPPASGFVLA